jgi:hypothetical protein
MKKAATISGCRFLRKSLGDLAKTELDQLGKRCGK